MRPKRAQRLLGDLGPLECECLAGVVLGAHEARRTERLAQRAWEDAEANDAERLEPSEHLAHERALQSPPLKRIAVDEQRRVQRVERRYPDAVERAGARPAEIGLARP